MAYFTNYDDMLTWEKHSPFTNGIENTYQFMQIRYLPTNFFSCISNEIADKNFGDLICMGRIDNSTNSHQSNKYLIAICNDETIGDETIGFAIRADVSSFYSTDAPQWAKRLNFYLTSRFEGHTSNFVTQAVLEDGLEFTNLTLPFGFPEGLKKLYWVPSGWVKGDMQELDNILCDLPKEDGLIQLPRIWLIEDGQFCWIYWLNHGFPFSERRDPLEYNQHYRKVFDAATKEALNELEKQNIHLGFKLFLANELKRILKEKYKLNWLTPKEMNQRY